MAFRIHERVRVKFGAGRGSYGTVVHVGGDDGTYYGVKLDCDERAIGYSEYELASAGPAAKVASRPLWRQDPGAAGSGCYVPRIVAECPECGSTLTAECTEHEVDTGRPIATGIEVVCDARESRHRWHQRDGKPEREWNEKRCHARGDSPGRQPKKTAATEPPAATDGRGQQVPPKSN